MAKPEKTEPEKTEPEKTAPEKAEAGNTEAGQTDRIPWKSGQLWSRLKQQSAHGLQTGALQPIATNSKEIEDGGVRFLVRILANISRKE